MSSVLERIQAKITRAKQHIKDFQLALSAFRDTNPYAVSYKEEPDTGKRVYYVSKADAVPVSVAAIAADIIQNLRSPLDQIVYQLMAAAGADETALRRAEYPIRDTAAYYPSA